jgi:hypothetical protein
LAFEVSRVPRRPFSTIPDSRVPTVTLIAPSAALLDACRETIRYVAVANIEVSDVKAAATNVAKWRPFAIVIEEDVFDFDPAEFEALARDVGGEIVTVPGAADSRSLVGLLLPRLKGAYARWDGHADSLE